MACVVVYGTGRRRQHSTAPYVFLVILDPILQAHSPVSSIRVVSPALCNTRVHVTIHYGRFTFHIEILDFCLRSQSTCVHHPTNDRYHSWTGVSFASWAGPIIDKIPPKCIAITRGNYNEQKASLLLPYPLLFVHPQEILIKSLSVIERCPSLLAKAPGEHGAKPLLTPKIHFFLVKMMFPLSMEVSCMGPDC